MEGEGGIERTAETTTGTEIGIEAPAGMTEIETEIEISGTVTGVIAAETNLGTDSSENRTMTEGDACRYEMKERERYEERASKLRACVATLFIRAFCIPVLSCCYCASYVKCSERRCYICPVLSCLLSVFASMPTTFPPYFVVARRPHCLITKPFAAELAFP